MPNEMATAKPLNSDASFEANAASTVTDAQIQKLVESGAGDEAHIREMLGVAGDEVKPVTPTEGNPEGLLAGKFKTETDLNLGIENITQKLGVDKEQADKLIDALGAEGAYKHYASELGKGTASEEDKDGDALSSSDSDGDALSGDDDGSTENNTDAKLDLEALNTEYQENGELSEASYKALEEAGFGKETVDTYIKGLEAQAELWSMKVHNMAGGADQYDAMVEWGSNNLNPAEIQRFDSALASGDADLMNTMITALQARYEAANGTFNRNSIESSTAVSDANVQGFGSHQEMVEAMKDPQYQSGDPVYHKMVMDKLKNSNF